MWALHRGRYFALGMATAMAQYEAEIAPLKRRLFAAAVAPKNEVLELGMGTGPNLKYYCSQVRSRLNLHYGQPGQGSAA